MAKRPAHVSVATVRQRPDPTLPYTPIAINGVDYRMCFDLGALAEAESHLVAAGHDVNLLAALPRLNVTNARVLFAASLYTYHPEIGFADALSLVTFPVLVQVTAAIAEAWSASMPEASAEVEKKNPTQAGD